MSKSSEPTPVNPYFYGGPIKDPHDFFGREEQILTVFERLTKGGSTSLIGQRMSGKTSLLHYLMTGVAQSPYPFDAHSFVFVYVDPQLGLRGPHEFYRKVVEAVAKQLPSVVPDAGSEVDEDQVLSVLEKLAPRRLVLLLDEFQTITSVGSFPPDFFRALRWFAEHLNVCFVTATTENLYECCPPEVVSSPFPNIFAATYLGSWTQSEFDHFLAETSKRSDAPILRQESEICGLAGRFPFYVQMACSFYFDVWRQHGEIGFQDHVSIKQRFTDEARPCFERVWKRHLTLKEKAALVTLTHAKGPSDGLTLRRLTQKGWVLDGHVFSSAFAEYIRRQEAEGETPPLDVLTVPRRPAAKGIWVDKEAGEVWVDGKRVSPLTSLEYKLLLCLYNSPNYICNKYDIVRAVWSGEYMERVDDSRIAKLVSRLRKRVEPDPARPHHIVTVHGRGYRLITREMQ
jgi:DNA-binding winged helix-turn-helix (wHTH) protein